jgi:hypothetical protein
MTLRPALPALLLAGFMQYGLAHGAPADFSGKLDANQPLATAAGTQVTGPQA